VGAVVEAVSADVIEDWLEWGTVPDQRLAEELAARVVTAHREPLIFSPACVVTAND